MCPRPAFAEGDTFNVASRGLVSAWKGFAFVVDTSTVKESTLVHWLVTSVDGGRLFVRCIDAAMNVGENVADDVLASPSTMLWNIPSKAWSGGAVMADSSLNRRMTVRLGPVVAFAQIGIVGFDGQIELETLRLYGLQEAAPALHCGTPTLPVGQRDFAAEVTWDLPPLAPGATNLLDVTVTAAGRAIWRTRRSLPRRASSRSIQQRPGPTTRSGSWRATYRPARPSTSARPPCRFRRRSVACPEAVPRRHGGLCPA